MAVIVTSYGKVARRTLRYPKADKQHNSAENPRVLRSTGVNVSIEGADRVFAGLRRKYNSKGAQTLQTIVSFSKAEMNPDDPADHDRAMQLLVVIATFALPPDTPSVIYLQADGKTGCLHGHIVSCTTLPQDCELDGVKWKAGRKLAGAWTEIGAYRERCNVAMAEAGFENELQHVAKPDVRYTKYESGTKLRQQDFDERAARGELKKDEVRPEQTWRIDLAELLVRCSVEDPLSVTEDGLKQAILNAGSEVRVRVLKSGREEWSYRRPGTESWIRGKTLGAFFTRERMLENVELRSKGLERRRPAPRQVEDRPDKPAPEVTVEQVEDAREVMARMVAEEQARASADELHEWLWDRIADEELAQRSGAMARWQEYGESFLDDDDMAQLRVLMDTWRVEQETQRAARSAASRAAYEVARRARLSPQERLIDDLAQHLGLPDDEAVWDELRDVVMTRSPGLLSDDDEDRWVDAHLGDVDVNAVLRRAGMPVIGDGDVVAAGHIGFGSNRAENGAETHSEPADGTGPGRPRVGTGLLAEGDEQILHGAEGDSLRNEETGSGREATGTASEPVGRFSGASDQEFAASGSEGAVDWVADRPGNGQKRVENGSVPDQAPEPPKRSVAELEAELARLREQQVAELQARLDELQRKQDEELVAAGLLEPVEEVDDEAEFSEQETSDSAPAASSAVDDVDQAVLDEEPSAAAQTPGSAPAAPGAGQTSAPAAARPTDPQVGTIAAAPGETPKQERERLAMQKFMGYASEQIGSGLRIDDKRVPKGITHDKLKVWRANGLDEVTFEQMSMRTTKYELSRFEFEVGMELQQEMAMFKPGEAGYTVRAPKLKASNARKDRLRAEIAAGIYEDLEGGGSGGGSGSGSGSGAGIETPVSDDKEYGD